MISENIDSSEPTQVEKNNIKVFRQKVIVVLFLFYSYLKNTCISNNILKEKTDVKDPHNPEGYPVFWNDSTSFHVLSYNNL